MATDPYDEAVKTIGEVEAAAKKVESSIDLTKVVSYAPPEKKGYDDLVDLIEAIETKRKPRQQAEAQMAQGTVAGVAEEQSLQPHLITAGLAQSQYAQQPGTPKASGAPEAAQRKKAAEELRSMAAAMGGKEEAPPGEVIQQSGMVLVTLSIDDQVQELQRIMQGLAERVFTDEQLKVVREEVAALRKKAASDKRTRKGRQGEEFGLEDIRDERLEEIDMMLKQYG